MVAGFGCLAGFMVVLSSYLLGLRVREGGSGRSTGTGSGANLNVAYPSMPLTHAGHDGQMILE